MSMYFAGIDISKYKHDCCIIAAANQSVVDKFTSSLLLYANCIHFSMNQAILSNTFLNCII